MNPAPSRHRSPNVVKWFACVLLLALPGCTDQMHRYPPSVPPVTSGIDPAQDAQTRLLESAYRAFNQERYALASGLLQRFVYSYPDSPRLNEARWWLARSYEQAGDLPAALSTYRALVGEAQGSIPQAGSYEIHALNRLDEFRRSLGLSSLLERRQIALWLTSEEWRAIPDIEQWIDQVADTGVTALIIEAASPSRERVQSVPMGVYFQTSKASVIEDLFTVIVPAAHAKGMAVLASLNLHEPGWLEVNHAWGITNVNRTDKVLPVAQVDVLHPAYQRLVYEMTQDLLRAGIDGLVVEAKRTKGFAEEWSPTSQRIFEGLFGPSFNGHNQSASLEAWRWAGWKTRTYLEFVARLTQQLRKSRPGLVVAVAVHEQAVFLPSDALTEYGEDVFETKQRGLHLVVQPEPGMFERSDEQRTKLETIRQRLAQAAGDERQLWLGTALSAADPSSLMMSVRDVLATKLGHRGPHVLLLVNRPAIP